MSGDADVGVPNEKSKKALYANTSQQAQLDVQHVPESAKTPGPGHYFGPGNEGFSSFDVSDKKRWEVPKCQSAPSLPIAKTGWEEWSCVSISKGHEKAFKGRLGPAPNAYNHKLTTLSEISAKIGTSERPDIGLPPGVDRKRKGAFGYELKDSWGKHSQPSPKELQNGFGKADRFFTKRENYKNLEYTRKDVAVQKNTGRSFGVGRQSYDKVIRPGWEKEGMCKESVGYTGDPIYSHVEKDGKMIPGPLAAVCPKSASCPFGLDARFSSNKYVTCSPGPGAYDREEGAIGTTPCVPLKTSPMKAKLGTFGKKPTKPRFRPDLAMNTGKHGGWGYH